MHALAKKRELEEIYLNGGDPENIDHEEANQRVENFTSARSRVLSQLSVMTRGSLKDKNNGADGANQLT